MPCARHLIGNPGDAFRFRITDVQNVLACVGRLRTTGPDTGQSRDFMLAELQAGIGWELEAEMSYTLRIIVQPDDPAETIQITAQNSFSPTADTCSRDDAGQIAVWTIDVLG
jgi:hypothetical protein